MKYPRFFKLCLCVFLLCAMISPLAAQEKGSETDSGEDRKPTAPKNIPKWTPDTDSVYQPSDTGEFLKETIIIQGTVIQEDGSPPPSGTTIVRDCGPDVTQEALVDSNGFFSFMLGDQNRVGGLPADASENYFNEGFSSATAFNSYESSAWFKNLESEIDLFGCSVRAQYTGYRSTVAELGVDQNIGLIDVGTIIIYPIARVTGTVVSATSLKAPKPAKKALKKGLEAFKKNERDEAEKYFLSAVAIYPEFADAWIELGWLYKSRGRNEDAFRAFKKASDSDKKYVKPYIHLAHISAVEKKWEKAIKYSQKALSMDPVSFPQAYFLNALSNYSLERLDQAEESIRRGIKLDIRDQVPKMYLVLANILSKKRDPGGSMDALKRYLELSPNSPNAENVRSLIKKHEKNIHAQNRVPAGDTE